MPERKSGRRNDGKLCLSDGSGLYCRHAGPADVLGRGYYRGEALICSSCFLLTVCLGIGRATRSRPIIGAIAWAAIMSMRHNKFLGSLTKS